MEGKAVVKVEGGKLLKVKLNYKQGTIKKIRITGDFFLHPEECIEHIEIALIDVPLNKDRILEAVNYAVEENEITMIGITPEAIVDAILEAAGIK